MASTSAANRGILKHQIRRVPYFDSNTLTYQVPHRSKLYFYPPSRAPDILFGTGGLYLTETAKSVTARAVAKAASASAGASAQTGASLASAASNSSATATASSAITAAASASPPPPPQTPAGRRASSNRHSPTPDGGVDGSDSRSLRGARETPVPSSPARPGRPRRKAAVPAEDRAAAAAESICTKCYEPCARDDADKRSISCGDCGHQCTHQKRLSLCCLTSRQFTRNASNGHQRSPIASGHSLRGSASTARCARSATRWATRCGITFLSHDLLS